MVDVYRTSTMAAADIGIVLNPGTDGALACAMMQVMLAEGMADETFLAELTDFDTDVRTISPRRRPNGRPKSPESRLQRFAHSPGCTAAPRRVSCGSASVSPAAVTAPATCTR